MKKKPKLKYYALCSKGIPLSLRDIRAKYNLPVGGSFRGCVILFPTKATAVKYFKFKTHQRYTEKNMAADGIDIIQCLPLIMQGLDKNIP